MPALLFSGHRGPVYGLTEALGNEGFYSGSGDGRIVEWRIDRPDEGTLIAEVGQAVFALTLLREEALILVGTEGGGLHVVDVAERQEVQLLKVHDRGIFRMIRTADERILCAGGDGLLSVWSATERRLELVRQIPLSEDKLRDLAISPDGEQLAVASGDGTIRILDTQNFNELHTLHPVPTDASSAALPGDDSLIGIGALAYHPTKPVLISGGKDGQLRVWQVNEEYRPTLAFPAHKGSIYAITFNADYTRCATASRDKSAKIWDAGSFAPLDRLDRAAGGHTHSVNAVLWRDEILLTASDDRRILGWPSP